jgi:thymidylate synthase (FAD)
METKRIVNQGAERFLDEEIKVLDKGHIILRDYLGSDESIVAAARVSYNKDVRLDDHEGNGGSSTI